MKYNKRIFGIIRSFYENEVCTPVYYGVFYDNQYGDNKQATYELGQKLKRITMKGIIMVDSQVTIPYSQKAYIEAYVPNDIVKKITGELNRFNNIIAFYYDLKVKQEGSWGLYVTYDDYKENALLRENFGFATGEPYTHVGLQGTGTLNLINRWLNSRMKKIINNKTYSQLVIIDADFNSP